MKFVFVFVLLVTFISGCGISSFRCSVETDEELLKRVIMEVRDGDAS